MTTYVFFRPGNAIYPILSRYCADEYGERFEFRSDQSNWPTLFAHDKEVVMAVIKAAAKQGIILQALEFDETIYTDVQKFNPLRSSVCGGNLFGSFSSVRR